MGIPYVKVVCRDGLTFIAMEDRMAHMLLDLSGSVSGDPDATYRGWSSALYSNLHDALVGDEDDYNYLHCFDGTLRGCEIE